MKKFLPTIVLLAIALSLNIYFRLGTAVLPFTKQLAKDAVMADIYREANQRIEKSIGEVPPAVKHKAVAQLVNVIQRQRKGQIKSQIALKQKEIRSRWQDDAGQTFLSEIDPYHWYRLTKNLVDTGRIGSRVSEHAEYDDFMLAPEGMKAAKSLHQNLHVILSAGLFKLLRLFNKNISLMQFVFYIPVIISSITIILAFFMCFSISASRVNIAGFFAAISLGLAPIFLARSMGGWFDTDPYVILFSMLSVWLFYLSFEYAAQTHRRVIYASLAGVSIGLFSFTWDGWWYIFDLLVISGFLYLFNLYLMRLENPQDDVPIFKPLLPLAVFIFSSLGFVGIFCGPLAVKQALSGPIDILFAKGYLQNQFWPNTFLTVDELNKAAIIDVINKAGGVTVILSGLIYMLISLLNKKPRDYKRKQIMIFFFTIWMLIMVYVSLKAQRFSLLLVIPASISFGLFLEGAIIFLSDRLALRLKSLRVIIKAALFFLACLILAPLLGRASQLRNYTAPAMDRNWYEVLKKLEAQTDSGSIINSWWDFGHWFKAIANRAVIFDGATQNTPMAYWMGRVIVSQNELEAMGILRMLNSGSNRAFEELEKLGIDKYKCVDILNEIILLKKDEAAGALAKYVPLESDRQRILKYTHHPRPAYFLVEPSLMPKIHPISFLGNWDFKKADIYRKSKEFNSQRLVGYLMKEYGYKQDAASQLDNLLAVINPDDALEWISRPYNFYNASRFYRKEGNLLMFDNDFIVDLSSHNVYFSDIRDGKWKVPKSLFYQQAGVLKENKFDKSDVDFSAILIGENDDYRIIVVDTALANSILVKLYYLGGAGLKYFKPFMNNEFKDISGGIMVYKLAWE